MRSEQAGNLTTPERRSALRWMIANGVLWSVGNSLTTGTLMTYLALELGATRAELGYIFALVAFAGLFRLVTPRVIREAGSLKRVAILSLVGAYLAIVLLPVVLASRLAPGDAWFAIYIFLLAGHQLLENIGTVTVWSWMGALVPRQIRGRYFGKRDAWKLLSIVPVIVAAGLFTDRWRANKSLSTDFKLWGYAIPIAIGGVMLLSSALVLRNIPDVPIATVVSPRKKWFEALRPLGDQRFQRLMLFGVWSSFCNGLTQSAQASYPYFMLDMATLPLLMMRAGMNLGQSAVSPQLGLWCDRLGNRTVMAVCQFIAATGLLYFLLASPAQPWWLVGAWIAFVAYAGVNIGLNNLMLKLAPPGQSASYVANFLGFTAVAFAAGSLAGGVLFEVLSFQKFPFAGVLLDDYDYMFYIGWTTRMMAVLFLFGLDEPGVRSWRSLLFPARTEEISNAVGQPHPLD